MASTTAMFMSGGLSYFFSMLFCLYQLYGCYKDKNDGGREVVWLVGFALCFTMSCMFGNYAYYGYIYP